MKFKILIILLFALFLVPPSVSAQTTYNDAFMQYNLKMEDYNKAHEVYVVKRSAYLKFKSLQSEKEARDATVTMLQLRDDVVIAYITALKLRMNESPGIPTEELANNQKLLDAEIAFFRDHKLKISSAGTLQDLVNDSNLAKKQYETDTRNFFYKIIFSISNGKVSDLKTRLTDNLTLVKGTVNTIRDETRPEYQFTAEKISAIDRFVFDSENKLTRATEKQQVAMDTKNVREYTSGEYTKRLIILSETQQLLKEASSFLKEIVSQIKNK